MGIYFRFGSAGYGYRDGKRSKELEGEEEEEEEGAGESYSNSSRHHQTVSSSALRFQLLAEKIRRIAAY